MQRSAIVLLAVAIVTLFSYSEGTIGLDLSFWQGDVPQSSWNCLRSNGYSFAIVQVWKESGSLNQHAADGIKRAWAAGFAHVDAYLFPRFGMDGGVQVRDSVNFLRNNGAKFGMLWIDIEDRAEWGNCDQNIALLRQIVQVSQQMGVNVGIYASATQWSSIMCGRTGFQNLPLWYPHYDGNPSFSDFRAFGGWSKPSIKQYRGSFGICGTTIDASFY